MQTQQILAALALAAPLVSSSPLDLSKRGQSTFHVDQVPSGSKSTKNAASAYKKALAKYKANIPDAVSEAAATQSRSATATPQGDDLEYTGQCGTHLSGVLEFKPPGYEICLQPDEDLNTDASVRVVPVTIGSGQTLQLDFDTGSADL